MNAIRALLLGTALATLAVGAVNAADPATSYDSTTYDWNGFYLGVIGGGSFDTLGTYGDLGGAAGYIVTYQGLFGEDSFFDIEGSLLGYAGPVNGYEATISWRSGLRLDNVLLYTVGGLGSDTGALYTKTGAGVWAGINENFSMRGEVSASTYISSGFGTIDWVSVTGGAFWHF